MALPVEAVGRLAEAVVSIATGTEGSLLQLVQRHLSAGLDGPGWASRQAEEVRLFRLAARAVAKNYTQAAGSATTGVLTAATELGEDAARAELADFAARLATRSVLPGGGAVVQLAAEMAGIITSSADTVLRQTEDAYRRVVAEVAGNVLLGGETRRQVTQRALDRLAGRGVTGFVDRSGRRWDLASYLEMATRTAAQRAMTAAHSDHLQSRGLNLVIVSNAPQECPRCRPWEGKVLSLDGTPAGSVRVPSLARNSTTTVRVDGTLAQAKADGLYHPGCRHSHSAYLPGITERPPAGSTADPEGDAARTRLRELERRVRKHKRAELLAVDDAARARARAQVRAGQAAIRDHVATTSVRRVPAREQLVRARADVPPLKPTKTTTPEAPPTIKPRWNVGRDVRVVKTDDETREFLENQRAKQVRELEQVKADRKAELDRIKAYPGSTPADVRYARKHGQRFKFWAQDEARLKASISTYDEQLSRFGQTNLPDYNPANPLEFYGDRVQHDGSTVAAEHLGDLEQFSPGVHRVLRDHFADSGGGGFYVGDKAVPDLDDLGDLRGRQPRGWAPGSSFDQVPGVYSPGDRVCACGGGGHGHGSTSLAMHEGSHALDHALTTQGHGHLASTAKEFQGVAGPLAESPDVVPYFAKVGNRDGWESELFAEARAAYTKGTTAGEPDGALARRIMGALTNGKTPAGLVPHAERLVAFFRRMDRELEDR